MKPRGRRSEKDAQPASARAEKAPAIDKWRQVGGIYYPERNVPFELGRDGFAEQTPPKLPGAESLRTLAEKFPDDRRLADAAQQAQQWKDAGGVAIEDFWAGRELIDKLLSCSAVEPHALAVLAWIVEYALVQLANLVAERKNKNAATLLYSQLAIHVEKLDELAAKWPKLFQPLAYQLPSFPVMGSKFKEQQLFNEGLVKDVLDVGRDHWMQQHRKPRKSPRNKAARAKEIAAKLIGYLQKYRIVYPELSARVADLPPWTKKLRRLKALSPETWSNWFELAWSVVLETTGGEPSQDDAYRQIAKRFRRPGAKGTVVEAVTGAIQEALRNAFSALATGRILRPSRAKRVPPN